MFFEISAFTYKLSIKIKNALPPTPSIRMMMMNNKCIVFFLKSIAYCI